MKKIRLYWWRDEPNFGDAASEYIIRHLFGAVEWRQPQITIRSILGYLKNSIIHGTPFKMIYIKGYVFPWQKALFGIGSILDSATYKSLVWGSGFREEYSTFKGGKVYAVRGKLSLQKVPINHRVGSVALGDPALLLPLVYQPKKEKLHKVSIIPHFVEFDYFYQKYSSKYHIIDVRTEIVERVIDEICSSQYVMSSSLHGVIIAQAYGIPVLWIKHGWINSSDFKFKDYFSGVNIPKYDGLTNYDEVLRDEVLLKKTFEEYQCFYQIKDLKTIQQKLIQSFPIQECKKENQHNQYI